VYVVYIFGTIVACKCHKIANFIFTLNIFLPHVFTCNVSYDMG